MAPSNLADFPDLPGFAGVMALAGHCPFVIGNSNFGLYFEIFRPDAKCPLTGAPMATTDRIEINPKVMLGKPVIRGTRVTVELILRKLGEGATEAVILDAYPQLKQEDIRAAMAYAADTLAHEETVLLKNQA